MEQECPTAINNMLVASNFLIGLGLFILIGSWCILFRYLITKQTATKIPLLGSVLLILGVYLHPADDFIFDNRSWVLLALFLDLGSIPFLVSLLLKKT